ncbi:MAG TPA: phage tail protein [Gemmatimonadaceae bacterium]
MGSSKKQTVGYRYYLGMHLAICHGPVDAVTEIQVGERQAWSGNLAASGRINLAAPELFGGEKREGGVSGAVDVAFGGATQTANDYLQAKVGTPQPAYRGILGLILRQVYIAANNPYIKPWAVRVKRCFRDWYSTKAEISGAANPAHILYECLTNAAWGMGYPSASIDDASFRAAADTLAAEGFGLNLIWLQQSTIEQFVREVLDHIGGVLTTSPSTGRFVLKLVRADYAVANLPVLDPTNVIELESFQRAAWGETTNELVLVYTKPDTFKDTSITVQDLANIQAQGAVVSQTRRYPGITSDSLAARVALRDLAAVSTPLAKVRLKVNRKAWNLYPADVFKLVWPPLGIEGLVMRIAAIDGGTLTQGAISIDAVEDVFGLPAASYTAPQPPGWVDPVPAPSAASPRRLVEAPYWDIARTLSASELAYLDATDCFLQTLGGRPAAGAINYEIHSKTSSASTYNERGQGEFAPHAVLASDIGQAVTGTLTYHSEVDIDLVAVGSYAYLNDEAVAITAINAAARTLTVNRGVLDTVPVAHAAGSRIWFADGFQGIDPTEYAVGETVNARLLTVTGKGTLALASAPTDSLAMNRRQNRPYPPGNLRINAAVYPATVKGDLAISWSHRDRLSQTVNLTAQSAGNIGPESGVTYTLRIYGEAGSLRRTYSGLTGTSQTYTLANDEADSGLGRPNAQLRIELEANRSSVTSLQKHSVSVERAGYGLHYDKYYGGI